MVARRHVLADLFWFSVNPTNGEKNKSLGDEFSQAWASFSAKLRRAVAGGSGTLPAGGSMHFSPLAAAMDFALKSPPAIPRSCCALAEPSELEKWVSARILEFLDVSHSHLIGRQYSVDMSTKNSCSAALAERSIRLQASSQG